MGQPAAKQGDKIVGADTHLIQTASGAQVPTPMPFNGALDNGLSPTVKIMGRPAAVVGSSAANAPPHLPGGGTFVKPPSNQGRVFMGSKTVFINNKPAARNGDKAMTCNDPADAPVGAVVATGTVLVGG
jgi:uncharacterized Zn-binding protein involved in type VI secretion